jgi:hypothetical protein
MLSRIGPPSRRESEKIEVAVTFSSSSAHELKGASATMIEQHAHGPSCVAVCIALCSAMSTLACAPSVELGDENTGGAQTTGDAGGAAVEANLDAGSVSCSTPAGTIEPLTSLPEAYAAIEGRWRLCPPTFGAAPADAIAIEFGTESSVPSPEGSSLVRHAYFLVQGPSGAVRGQGFAYQLTYDVWPGAPGHFELVMQPLPNATFGGGFLYSPSPRELEILLGAGPSTVLLTSL